MVYDLTNRVRTDQSQATLTRDSTLARTAGWYNQDMLAHEYLGPEDADGRSPGDRMAREHRRFGEEDVFDLSGRSASGGQIEVNEWAASIIEGWMKSEDHRANILRQKYTHLGPCVRDTQSEGWATQVFAATRAYLDEPMPWSVPALDSLSVDVRPSRPPGLRPSTRSCRPGSRSAKPSEEKSGGNPSTASFIFQKPPAPMEVGFCF